VKFTEDCTAGWQKNLLLLGADDTVHVTKELRLLSTSSNTSAVHVVEMLSAFFEADSELDFST